MGVSENGGIYVYAVIPTADRIIFDISNDSMNECPIYTIPLSECARLAQSGLLGGTSGPAEGKPESGIAAVVSASPYADIRSLKRSDAAGLLVRHQRVTETIMQDFPILPVKFGTILADEAQVSRLLAQGETLFQIALAKYGGLVQMEVVVIWNIQKIFAEISQMEAVQHAKQQIADCSVEESLNFKVSLGQLVQNELKQRRGALQAEILPALSAISREVVANPLMDDSMVMNVALLLDEVGCEALDEKLDSLDTDFASRADLACTPLNFRRVGPLAPYSFATVDVQIPAYEVVKASRTRLEVEETTTLEEIKRAYYRQVMQVHPDLHPNLAEGQMAMAELTSAFRLLSACAASQVAQSTSRCGLDRETINNTLLINIQQQEGIA